MRQVEGLRVDLAEFVADVFASVPRHDQRAKGDCYLRGLMLDGRRKSIQSTAARLPDGNEQNLQQFVNQSTWDPVPVRRRITERMVPLIGPEAWAVDDVSFLKDGRMSVAVTHRRKPRPLGRGSDGCVNPLAPWRSFKRPTPLWGRPDGLVRSRSGSGIRTRCVADGCCRSL
jgi:hypothetical protein